jgi:hypothetical protein
VGQTQKQLGSVSPPANVQPLALSVSNDAGEIIAGELLNVGVSQAYSGLAATFFKDLLQDLPPSLVGITNTAEFKQELINQFSDTERTVNVSGVGLREFGISIVQTIVIKAFTDYISKHFSPELGEALNYGLNVSADTARGAAEGGAAGAYAAFATSATVNTAIEAGEAVNAYLQLRGTDNSLQSAMIRSGASDINLLAAAAINAENKNTSRSNQEYSLVNNSLVSYAAEVHGTPAYANAWSIITLLVKAKEQQLTGNLSAANADVSLAMDTAKKLNASQWMDLLHPTDYVALANEAAKAYGLK